MKPIIATLTLLFSFILSSQIDGTPKTLDTSLYCTLQLVKLECIVTEGYATADAIYFKINGEEWPKKRLRMNAGNVRDLEGYVEVEFEESIKIELWDDDTFDPDDHLGSNTISCSLDWNGVVRFTEDGANYKLYYRVK